MINTLPQAKLVTSPSQFTLLLDDLLKQKRVAVDTESNSLYAYRERICLMQFSSGAQDYLLDTLAVQDIEALGQVFTNPRIEKIFHAAEYDLSCMYRDYGWATESIFDTMMAARALGWPKVGLGNILQEKFNVPTNKRFQRTNWGKRPLSQDQLSYAQADTHYLLELRDLLSDRLQSEDHWEETQEEFDRIASSSLRRSYGNDNNKLSPDAFWSIAGARKLDSRQAAILRELYLYREAAAARLNRAPFRIIGNSTLVSIAQSSYSKLGDLSRIVGMTPGQMRRHGPGILSALERGRTGPPARPPKPKIVDKLVLARYDALREWRKKRAVARGVESDVIMARDVLWNLAYDNPKDLHDLENICDLGPWRRTHYGEDILITIRDIRSG